MINTRILILVNKKNQKETTERLPTGVGRFVLCMIRNVIEDDLVCNISRGCLGRILGPRIVVSSNVCVILEILVVFFAMYSP